MTAPRCCNCGHYHPGGACTHTVDLPTHREQCTCPAFNVRPRPAELTLPERIRVVEANIRDLDRSIGAMAQRRDNYLELLDTLHEEQEKGEWRADQAN